MRFNSFARHLAVVAAMATAAGCGDDTTGPMDDVAGAYEATTFLVTEGGVTFNVLDIEEFAFLLNLRSNGTTAGYVYVPPTEGEPDSGVDADLTGTWTLNADRVTLQHNADTFLREMEFTVVGETLVGSDFEDDGESGLSLVLSRK